VKKFDFQFYFANFNNTGHFSNKPFFNSRKMFIIITDDVCI